jgi:hypothetical protein
MFETLTLSEIKNIIFISKRTRDSRVNLHNLHLGSSKDGQLELLSSSLEIEFSLGQSLSSFFQDAQKIISAFQSSENMDFTKGFNLTCHCSKIYCAGAVVDYLLNDKHFDLKTIATLFDKWKTKSPDLRKRFLFSGSRDYNKLSIIKSAFAEMPLDCVVVVGDARGVDAEIARLAKFAGLTLEVYPALWDLYGLKAGVMRNNQMLESGIDYVYIFMQNDSPGATHMLHQCVRYGLPFSLARHISD